MRVADLRFDLPETLIARHPLPEHRASRLLVLDGPTGTLAHRQLADLLDYLRPGDLMVFSSTRVIPARLFDQKESGGRLEVLVERVLNQHRVLARIRASKVSKPDTRILVKGGGSAEILQRHDALFELAFAEPMLSLLEQVRHMPLPPYTDRPDDAVDHKRYQTVCAQRTSMVVAPTTGLYFDEAPLEAVRTKGVDAVFVAPHVGAGTFQPVCVERIEDHAMHREWLEVGQDIVNAVSTCQARGGRVAAVSATSVRSLESTTRDGKLKPFSGDINVFTFPGRPFHVVDALVTNFRLPRSTLLMLVSTFVNHPEIMATYAAAVAQSYRLLNYDDAMFITRNPAPRGPKD